MTRATLYSTEVVGLRLESSESTPEVVPRVALLVLGLPMAMGSLKPEGYLCRGSWLGIETLRAPPVSQLATYRDARALKAQGQPSYGPSSSVQLRQLSWGVRSLNST